MLPVILVIMAFNFLGGLRTPQTTRSLFRRAVPPFPPGMTLSAACPVIAMFIVRLYVRTGSGHNQMSRLDSFICRMTAQHDSRSCLHRWRRWRACVELGLGNGQTFHRASACPDAGSWRSTAHLAHALNSRLKTSCSSKNARTASRFSGIDAALVHRHQHRLRCDAVTLPASRSDRAPASRRHLRSAARRSITRSCNASRCRLRWPPIIILSVGAFERPRRPKSSGDRIDCYLRSMPRRASARHGRQRFLRNRSAVRLSSTTARVANRLRCKGSGPAKQC